MGKSKGLFKIGLKSVKESVEDSKKFDLPSGYFRPRPVDEKTPYEAKVRFVPYFRPDNEDEPLVNMYSGETHYIRFPRGHELARFNGNYPCQRTIGQECKICDVFFALYNIKDKSDWAKTMMNYIRRGRRKYAYVYVLEDKQTPDNVGKVLVWEFNDKILNLIELLEKDEELNAFDMLESKNMKVEVGMVKGDDGNNYPNYEKCRFAGKTVPISFYNEDGDLVEMTSDDEDYITEKILEREVELSVHEPKEFDEDTKAKINEFAEAVFPSKGNGVKTEEKDFTAESAVDKYTEDDEEDDNDSEADDFEADEEVEDFFND